MTAFGKIETVSIIIPGKCVLSMQINNRNTRYCGIGFLFFISHGKIFNNLQNVEEIPIFQTLSQSLRDHEICTK